MPLVIYDVATAPFLNFLKFEENSIFFFISVGIKRNYHNSCSENILVYGTGTFCVYFYKLSVAFPSLVPHIANFLHASWIGAVIMSWLKIKESLA
jgi:hypothetical protein